jgi:hypothetical protein
MLRKYQQIKIAVGLVQAISLVWIPSCKPPAETKAGPVTPAVTTSPTYTQPVAAVPITPPVWQPVSTFTPMSGCMKNQVMQQVEIAINGSIEAPFLIDSGAKAPRNNDGLPTQLSFEFNKGFSSSVTDGMNQMRANQGKITLTDLTSYTVDQIAYIKISLDGHSYQSDEFTESGFWSGQVSKYRVSETNRLRINSLSIRINGQEFYRLGALNKTLQATGPSWKEENLAQNLVTKKLLQQDCAAMSTVTPGAAATPGTVPVTPTPGTGLTTP